MFRVLFPLLLVVLASCGRAEDKTLYRQPSAFNELVVTENPAGLRTLWFGENGVRQSVVKPDDPDHLELAYLRVMPVGMALVESPRRALIVGLGGGSLPRFLHKHWPELTIDIVDIDPDVVKVARQFFGFRDDERMKAHVADGRTFIEQNRQPYDLIFLDAYGADNIPFRLATREFLEAVRRAVTPTGAVVANVWSSASNALYGQMVRTYQAVFPRLYVFNAPGSGNVILTAFPREVELQRGELVGRVERLSRGQRLSFDFPEYIDLAWRGRAAVGRELEVLRDK